MRSSNFHLGWRRTTLPTLVLLIAAGCGSSRYPVHGRVVYDDGSPLKEGTIVGEMMEGDTKINARGSVQSDGTFQWGTEKPGDGARPGKYRVAVIPRALGDEERSQGKLPAVDEKYTKFETSRIEIEVKEGKNELPITVTRPKGKSR